MGTRPDRRVARTGRSLLIRDVNREPDYQPGDPNVRAELAIDQCRRPRAGGAGAEQPAIGRVRRGRGGGSPGAVHARAAALRRALRYQELLETSTQLSQVVTSMPIGLALLDIQGRVLRHNPAWAHVWGIGELASDELFHVPWDLVPQILARLTNPMGLNDFCANDQSSPTDVQTTTIRLRDPHQRLDVLSVPTRDSLGQLTEAAMAGERRDP